MSADDRKIFLTARWENLILATYKVEPELLISYLPAGLELDTIGGAAFISLVAFDFIDTKVKGLPIPFNVNFPEINLRFYVKDKERRGVVFIREFVPNYLTVIGANIFFNENYKRIEMKNEITFDKNILARYTVALNSQNYFIIVEAENKPFMPGENSTEHFFKEHQWGFGTTRSGETLVYKVEHPYWEVYPVISFETNFDFAEIYGNHWKSIDFQKPYSIVLAKGSGIKVYDAGSVNPDKK